MSSFASGLGGEASNRRGGAGLGLKPDLLSGEDGAEPKEQSVRGPKFVTCLWLESFASGGNCGFWQDGRAASSWADSHCSCFVWVRETERRDVFIRRGWGLVLGDFFDPFLELLMLCL